MASKEIDCGATIGHEAEVRAMADALRGWMDATEYKHVVLGLIFLESTTDVCEEHHAAMQAEWDEEAAQDGDEYLTENTVWVPAEARWVRLKAEAEQQTIGHTADRAMAAIKKDKHWHYGIPTKGNVSFAWVQYQVHHLAPKGVAGLGLANGSMSLIKPGEWEIQKHMFAASSGSSKSASWDGARNHGRVLMPGRYVDPQKDDCGPIEEKMKWVVAELHEHQARGTRLDAAIKETLRALTFGGR